MDPATLCATCSHTRERHSDFAGCIVNDVVSFCPCERFVEPAPEPTPTREEGLAAGRAARDAGAALAGAGAPASLVAAWRDKAGKALDELIRSGMEFSADDVVERAGEPPVPNMLGGLFLAASTAGRIHAVGLVSSARPKAHARVQRTWIGGQGNTRLVPALTPDQVGAIRSYRAAVADMIQRDSAGVSLQQRLATDLLAALDALL